MLGTPHWHTSLAVGTVGTALDTVRDTVRVPLICPIVELLCNCAQLSIFEPVTRNYLLLWRLTRGQGPKDLAVEKESGSSALL